jgi:ferritin
MEAMDLPGMAAWLRHQADEEIVHANKFIDHLVDRGNHPVIGAVAAPQTTVGSVLECFTAALEHEHKVSESIRELYRRADAAGDLDSRPLLMWFLSEQVEEEATVNEIVGRVTLINDDGPGLLRLDGELGQRPTTSTENRA